MEWINKGINYPDSYVVWPPLFKEESSTYGLSLENIILHFNGLFHDIFSQLIYSLEKYDSKLNYFVLQKSCNTVRWPFELLIVSLKPIHLKETNKSIS